MNYSCEELEALGFASLGTDVAIHRTGQVFGAEHMRIGSHVRIDCFAAFTAGAAGFRIGDHVHVAVGVAILGSAAPLVIDDFGGLSPRVTLFTATDGFIGDWLTGPTIPPDLRKVALGHVRAGRHVIVGAGTVVLPNVELREREATRG